MWARVLLLWTLLSFSADLGAAGDDGGQERQRPLNSVCQLPQYKGPCDTLQPRWFYNSKSKRCERFYYGGCYGNGNNFKELNECEHRCVTPGIPKPGRCPMTISPNDSPCGTFCSSDDSCSDNQLCCETSCGKECKYPEGGICQLPEEMGPCRAHIPRWFYNKQMGKCKRFIYGGCGGNSNNFKTLEECELHCVLPDLNKPGTCPAIVQSEGTPCGEFCFKDVSCPSVQRCCDTSCGKECKTPQEHRPGYCPMLLLPPRTGDVCFHNCTNDGDCNHNVVNLPWKKCCIFAGRKICVDAVEEHPGVCLRRVKLPTLVPYNSTCDDDRDCHLTEKCCYTGSGKGCLPSVRSDRCQLPLQQDSCKEKLQRYYYDVDKKKCVSFMGCGDNRNSFQTRELCEKACGKISKEVCKLPAEPGRCLAYLEQYYYNWNTKKCEIFVYGMCNGNGNRFSTKLECQMVCGEFGQMQPNTA